MQPWSAAFNCFELIGKLLMVCHVCADENKMKRKAKNDPHP
jgi:hypothetical protein